MGVQPGASLSLSPVPGALYMLHAAGLAIVTESNNADSEQESNTGSHSARSKAQAAQQCAAEADRKAPQSKEQSP